MSTLLCPMGLLYYYYYYYGVLYCILLHVMRVRLTREHLSQEVNVVRPPTLQLVFVINIIQE